MAGKKRKRRERSNRLSFTVHWVVAELPPVQFTLHRGSTTTDLHDIVRRHGDFQPGDRLLLHLVDPSNSNFPIKWVRLGISAQSLHDQCKRDDRCRIVAIRPSARNSDYLSATSLTASSFDAVDFDELPTFNASLPTQEQYLRWMQYAAVWDRDHHKEEGNPLLVSQTDLPDRFMNGSPENNTLYITTACSNNDNDNNNDNNNNNETEEVIFEVNSRVKVYWDAEQQWYSGFCKARVVGKPNYWTIEYDDGDEMDSHVSELVNDNNNNNNNDDNNNNNDNNDNNNDNNNNDNDNEDRVAAYYVAVVIQGFIFSRCPYWWIWWYIIVWIWISKKYKNAAGWNIPDNISNKELHSLIWAWLGENGRRTYIWGGGAQGRGRRDGKKLVQAFVDFIREMGWSPQSFTFSATERRKMKKSIEGFLKLKNNDKTLMATEALHWYAMEAYRGNVVDLLHFYSGGHEYNAIPTNVGMFMKNFVTDHSKVFSRLAWQRKSHKHYVSKSLANTLTYWTSRLKKLDPGKRPIHHNNTVGYRGVSKHGKKYTASIYIGGNRKHIGVYDTAKEAAVAYDWAALKAGFSTTLLNFPDMVHNLDVEPKRKKQKVASNNTLGYKGIQLVRRTGKFEANISLDGKTKRLGTFITAIAAALAFDRAALKKGYKSHRLNFPDVVHNLDVEPKRATTFNLSSTGYKGVCKYGKAGKFMYAISINGKRVRISGFKSPKEAALAYDQAAIKAGRKKSTLNFPDR